MTRNRRVAKSHRRQYLGTWILPSGNRCTAFYNWTTLRGEWAWDDADSWTWSMADRAAYPQTIGAICKAIDQVIRDECLIGEREKWILPGDHDVSA
jgi:hypothetical protein